MFSFSAQFFGVLCVWCFFSPAEIVVKPVDTTARFVETTFFLISSGVARLETRGPPRGQDVFRFFQRKKAVGVFDKVVGLVWRVLLRNRVKDRKAFAWRIA